MTHTTINVKPGETFDIMISASEYVSIKQKLDDLGYPPSIKEIGFNLEEIYFDDGTAWTGGIWYKRDPFDPKRYHRMDRAPPDEVSLTEPSATTLPEYS